MKVYAFQHCPCRFESEFQTVSLHRYKASAYRAMMDHKNKHWHTERNLGLRFGNMTGREVEMIGWPELWQIAEMEVLD